jgi:hypothetical protein
VARWLLAGWCLLLVAGFGTAASLEPDPRGFGTHQRLGLPPCSILELFGVPCPSCGMTTSFAHFVRGQWPSSLRANSAGFLLALTCAVQIPWGLASVRRGRLYYVERPEWWALGTLVSLSALSLLQWLVRLSETRGLDVGRWIGP